MDVTAGAPVTAWLYQESQMEGVVYFRRCVTILRSTSRTRVYDGCTMTTMTLVLANLANIQSPAPFAME
jgi:hypothetical protein